MSSTCLLSLAHQPYPLSKNAFNKKHNKQRPTPLLLDVRHSVGISALKTTLGNPRKWHLAMSSTHLLSLACQTFALSENSFNNKKLNKQRPTPPLLNVVISAGIKNNSWQPKKWHLAMLSTCLLSLAHQNFASSKNSFNIKKLNKQRPSPPLLDISISFGALKTTLGNPKKWHLAMSSTHLLSLTCRPFT